MKAKNPNFDVIIIGGSFAGLSCAMTLGRSLRSVLIINEELPRNRRVDKAHNFIIADGREPFDILASAQKSVLKYKTVKYKKDAVTKVSKLKDIFKVTTRKGEVYSSDRLMLASGVKDIPKSIKGFSPCWGRSIYHCPYCHGYEIKNMKTGLLCFPENIPDLTPLLLNLTKKLVIFTNGEKLTNKQKEILEKYSIKFYENKINEIKHVKGCMKSILLEDGSDVSLETLFTHIPVYQCSDIPVKLGVKLNEKNIIITDENGRTNVEKIYAAGDCTNHVHQISTSISGGSKTAMCINREMVDEEFPMNLHIRKKK